MPYHKRHRAPQYAPDMLEQHRRLTLQIMFGVSFVVLSLFAVMNALEGRHFLAGLEIVSLLGLGIGLYDLRKTPHMFAWTLGYLLMVYGIILVAMLSTGPQEAAFVWLFLMPILAYIMLGKTIGLALSAPFVLVALADFTFKLWQEQGPFALPQYFILGNVYLCAVLIMVFIHIAEHSRAIAQSELVRLASTDPLTGLLNRGRFQHIMEESIAAVHQGKPGVALLILDLDYFKQINDHWGHDAGDQVLIELAQRLSQGVRATDCVARLGGEEFAILVRDLSLENSGHLAEEIRHLIVDVPFSYQGEPIQVTATFGVAHCPEDATTATTLYRLADRRLYAGKGAGRNRVVAQGLATSP